MSPLEVLEAAQAAGVAVQFEEGDLILMAAAEPPAGILDMLRRHKADLVEHLRAQASPTPSAPPPSPPVARPRGWSAADWRLFHNDRQLVAEIALGKTRGQARAYAYVCCIREWCRVRPGATEDQAITALAEKGITDPSPPPPVVEHLQVTGFEDDLPSAPAGVGGAGTAATDVAGSTHIIATAAGVGTDITGSAVPAMGIMGTEAGTT